MCLISKRFCTAPILYWKCPNCDLKLFNVLYRDFCLLTLTLCFADISGKSVSEMLISKCAAKFGTLRMWEYRSWDHGATGHHGTIVLSDTGPAGQRIKSPQKGENKSILLPSVLADDCKWIFFGRGVGKQNIPVSIQGNFFFSHTTIYQTVRLERRQWLLFCIYSTFSLETSKCNGAAKAICIKVGM